MLTFEKIKYYYDNSLWTKEMVANAVVKGKIDAGQYQEITEEPYSA